MRYCLPLILLVRLTHTRIVITNLTVSYNLAVQLLPRVVFVSQNLTICTYVCALEITIITIVKIVTLVLALTTMFNCCVSFTPTTSRSKTMSSLNFNQPHNQRRRFN